jgi:hypothetical protein
MRLYSVGLAPETSEKLDRTVSISVEVDRDDALAFIAAIGEASVNMSIRNMDIVNNEASTEVVLN